jgi:hypothetical protein
MDLDNKESGDNIATDSTGATATSETTSPVSETTATSTPAAPSPVEAADSSGPASAATQANADGSLTPANTTLQAANKQPTQAPVNWEQRYSELRKREAEITRQNQQYQQQFQQYQGIDPNAVRAWQQAQQRSQAEQLPVWNRNNPNNPRFQQTLAKFSAYKAAMGRAATPEAKQVVRETLGAEFSNDEVQAVQQWENHQQQFQANFAADPTGTIAGIVNQQVQQAIYQNQQKVVAEQSVGSWFDDPSNKTIVERYGREMMDALRNNQWTMVRDYYVNKAKFDGLQSRVGEADKAVTAAKEKDRLLQGAASVTRDPKVQTKVDPAAVAKKRGIQPGTTAFYDLLLELKEDGLLPD